jgi:hypothetical protein
VPCGVVLKKEEYYHGRSADATVSCCFLSSSCRLAILLCSLAVYIPPFSAASLAVLQQR